MQELHKVVKEWSAVVKRTVKESLDAYVTWLFVISFCWWATELFAFGAGERPIVSAFFAVAFIPPVFFSAKRIASEYSLAFKEAYFSYKESAGRVPTLSFYLNERRLWAELGGFALLYWLLPLKIFFAAPCALFFAGADGLLQKAILFFPLVLCLLALSVFARYTASKRFEEQRKNTDRVKELLGIKKKKKKSRLALSEYRKTLMRTTFIYLVGGCLLVGQGMLLLSFLKLIWVVLTTPQVGIPLALVLIAICSYRLIYGICKRARFYKALIKSCEKRGYRLSSLHRPYLSLFRFFESDEPTFTVSVGEKSYACRMVGALDRSTPLFFFDRGEELEGVRLYKLRFFKQDIFSFEDHFLCGFPSEHKRIVIVNPVCKSLYTSVCGKIAELDNGYERGKYEIYTGRAFINALERDVIDKKV